MRSWTGGGTKTAWFPRPLGGDWAIDYNASGEAHVIRLAASEHFATVARLHAEAIPHGFLTRLGAPLLTELYRSLACQPGTCVLVAVDEHDRCFGFIAGTIDTKGLFQRVLYRRWYRFAWLAARALLVPANLKSGAETLLYGLLQKREPGRKQAQAELLSVAVDFERQGKGTGKTLILALDAFLAEHGALEYKVVTSANDPRSNAFYCICGFTHIASFRHHERPMNEYVKLI